jgi:hypothetical protein
MEPYLTGVSLLVLSVFFVSFLIFFSMAMYHFIRLQFQYSDERHRFFASLIPFLFPYSPRFFTVKGNYHRAAYLRCLALALVSLGIVGITDVLLSGGDLQ